MVALVAAVIAGLTFGVKAGLDARQQGVAAPAARGTLSGTLVVTGRKGTLRWRLSVTGLTGPPRSAELRRGALGRRGPRLALLCSPCRPGAHGSVRLGASTVSAVQGGGVYAVVTTAKHPAGEIRGQLRVLGGA